jgi:hypothetical protein
VRVTVSRRLGGEGVRAGTSTDLMMLFFPFFCRVPFVCQATDVSGAEVRHINTAYVCVCCEPAGGADTGRPTQALLKVGLLSEAVGAGGGLALGWG